MTLCLGGPYGRPSKGLPWVLTAKKPELIPMHLMKVEIHFGRRLEQFDGGGGLCFSCASVVLVLVMLGGGCMRPRFVPRAEHLTSQTDDRRREGVRS